MKLYEDRIPTHKIPYKVLLVLFLVLVALAIFGCASLGLATPQGLDQQLAEAYGVHTAVVSATATAVTTGTISSTEGALVQTQANIARETLDTAKSIETSNPTGASNDLTLATTALTAIQTYLNSQTAAAAATTGK